MLNTKLQTSYISKTVIRDYFAVHWSWMFGSAWTLRIIKIYIIKSKLLRVAAGPFHIVHQSPGHVASDVTSVSSNGCNDWIWILSTLFGKNNYHSFNYNIIFTIRILFKNSIIEIRCRFLLSIDIELGETYIAVAGLVDLPLSTSFM